MCNVHLRNTDYYTSETSSPSTIIFRRPRGKPCLLCLMIESKEEKSYILWANTKERSEERPRKRLKRNSKKTLPRQKPYCLFMNKILIWKNMLWWNTNLRSCVFLWWKFWRLMPCLYSLLISWLLKDFSTFERK